MQMVKKRRCVLLLIGVVLGVSSCQQDERQWARVPKAIPIVGLPYCFLGRDIHLGMREDDLLRGRTMEKGELGYAEWITGNPWFRRADYFVDDGVLYRVSLRWTPPAKDFPLRVLDSLSMICDSVYRTPRFVRKHKVFGEWNETRAWAIGDGLYALFVYLPPTSKRDSVSLFFVLGEDSTQWQDVGAVPRPRSARMIASHFEQPYPRNAGRRRPCR
jgi:hypothetical protein